jgi:hypothetical protein
VKPSDVFESNWLAMWGIGGVLATQVFHHRGQGDKELTKMLCALVKGIMAFGASAEIMV